VRNPRGQKSGTFGPLSFQGDRLRAGLFSEKSGGATMGAIGSIKSSSSIELSGDHNVAYCVFDPPCRAAIFMWRFERYLKDLTGPWILD
jgi:hypothetical protein